MSKILEKIVYKQVINFLNKYEILYKSQYGFCSQQSCEQAVQELLAKILQLQENGHQTASIFMDLLKAFDTLNHGLLLQKMERYGIRGLPLQWFTSYLNGQTLVAKVPVSESVITYSSKFNVEYGTVQGSCLGPLLFIIFCNDIYLQEIYGSLILFADDTTLFNSHKSGNYLHFMLNHDFLILSDWFKANQLALNPLKSVVMYFNQDITNRDITMDGVVVPKVTTHKFLGTWIDDNLKWDTQVVHIVNKLRTNHHLLHLAKNLLSVNCLCTIYFSHIYTHLKYNLVVWGSMISKSQLSEIFQLQKNCIQLLGKRKNKSDVDLFATLKVIKFPGMIRSELCKFGAKVSRKLIPEPLQQIMAKRGGQKNHGYNTRTKNIPNVQKHTTTQFNTSFICHSVAEYMQLSMEFNSIQKIPVFVKKLKSKILNSYQISA